jgi:hypothetical protein
MSSLFKANSPSVFSMNSLFNLDCWCYWFRRLKVRHIVHESLIHVLRFQCVFPGPLIVRSDLCLRQFWFRKCCAPNGILGANHVQICMGRGCCVTLLGNRSTDCIGACIHLSAGIHPPLLVRGYAIELLSVCFCLISSRRPPIIRSSWFALGPLIHIRVRTFRSAPLRVPRSSFSNQPLQVRLPVQGGAHLMRPIGPPSSRMQCCTGCNLLVRGPRRRHPLIRAVASPHARSPIPLRPLHRGTRVRSSGQSRGCLFE